MRKILAGSYERFVWVWDADERSGELRQSLCRPSHLGTIKCAAGWGGDVVTGGSDDTIHILDLGSNRDVGVAHAHSASVTALQFYGAEEDAKASHLFCASEDGTISIWNASSWIHYKSMRGGNAAILDLSIHSCGKLALSVERGSGFRMWNLIKGRCSFNSKTASQASLVSFLPEKENAYAMACDKVVEIYAADAGKLRLRLPHDKPVLCMAPFRDELLFVGGEDCGLSAWDFRCGRAVFAVAAAHEKRVKGIDRLGDSHCLVSASSDGFVKVWDIRQAVTPLMRAETGARLTCVVGFSAGIGVSKSGEEAHKRKRRKKMSYKDT